MTLKIVISITYFSETKTRFVIMHFYISSMFFHNLAGIKEKLMTRLVWFLCKTFRYAGYYTCMKYVRFFSSRCRTINAASSEESVNYTWRALSNMYYLCKRCQSLTFLSAKNIYHLRQVTKKQHSFLSFHIFSGRYQNLERNNQDPNFNFLG